MASAAHDPDHHDAHDYHHGTMEIGEQRSTYDLFMGLTKWGSLAVAAIVIWGTLAFAVGTGWPMALGIVIVFVAAGIYFLRDKKPAAGSAERPH
jgi:hypothetical protein